MADDALTRKDAEMGRLLPCPFCGSADVDPKFSMFQLVEGEPSHDPGCMKCGASAPKDIWNKRALSLESVREEGQEKLVKLSEKGQIAMRAAEGTEDTSFEPAATFADKTHFPPQLPICFRPT